MFIVFFFFFFFFFSSIFPVPTAPPANVTAFNTSSVSIAVRWDQVPRAHRNGHLLGYKVCYMRADVKNSLMFCTAVYAMGLELGGLVHFKPYWITVLSYTNEGEGPEHKPILVWTDEFGESMNTAKGYAALDCEFPSVYCSDDNTNRYLTQRCTSSPISNMFTNLFAYFLFQFLYEVPSCCH